MSGHLPTGTKRSLLDLLLRGERTAEDLGGHVGVSAAAARQHLSTMAGLGLVERRKAPASGGRPAFLYRLSAEGRRAYPKRHDLLVRELIEAMIARQGRDRTLALVAEAGRRMADGASQRLTEPNPRERWKAVLAWLEEELGWEAVEEVVPGAGRRLVLHQCPFASVSSDHPAVCGAFFAALLERLIGGGPYAHRPIRDGLRCCALEERRGRGSEELDPALL